MADEEEYERLLGKAALNVWGDMPRDVQEALFDNAMRDRADLRSDLARLLRLLARLLLLVIRTDTDATVGHLVPTLVTVVVPASGGGRSTSTGV
jgi:hypothetical protein